jgi:hypothetical protein
MQAGYDAISILSKDVENFLFWSFGLPNNLLTHPESVSLPNCRIIINSLY